MRDHISSNPNPISSTRSRKKQAEVTIVGGMRSSSPAPPPGLSSGSSSPSISSVETSSPTGLGPGIGLGFGGSLFGDGNDGDVLAPVITARNSASASRTGTGRSNGAMHSSRASSSSWSTAAPSASSAASVGIVEHQAAPRTPGERVYTCLFHMLDCHDSFDQVMEWKTHVLSHFRTHPTPRTARCPLCSDEFVDEGDDESLLLSPLSISEPNGDEKSHSQENEGSINSASVITSSQDMVHDHSQSQFLDSAWNRMLNHVAENHYQNGQTLAGSRQDFELMRHLYNRRIISDAQFKAMQLAPAPSSPAYHRSQDGVRASIGSSDEPYYAPYSRRREERMRGATRGVSVV
ncbi:Zinc finger C2H2 [Penicillium longicatenatum]|uniref:Zinc finger C2H2 n=1 Tax=Penicillium longicatenatum TaxID=1561947 RepID=UPI0025471BBB|nr:Zinc finger C2H2 [Penicillium longicatenatum]KAJ5651305.1 Zinc finger C2H2 [Penicillium longicatenatum]